MTGAGCTVDYRRERPTANVPMTAGAGGSVRLGWFSNLYSFDLLDNKIEDDVDATGSTPPSLVTTYAYDFNQNLKKITKPQGNTVDYDYDERDMKIATRVGYDPAHGQNGAVSVQAFDGNGNLIDMVGPAQRGTAAQSLSVVIDDAFYGSTNQTFVGDWLVQNTYDGFDRLISSTDPVGGIAENTYDPGRCHSRWPTIERSRDRRHYLGHLLAMERVAACADMLHNMIPVGDADCILP